jgi:transcriptional regulator with XRE-family HTH domain
MSTATATTPDLRAGRMARVLLASRNAKQSDLAAVLGLDVGAMSKAINGKRKWTLAELETMASYFDVPISRFFEDPQDILRSRCFSAGIDQLELFANTAMLAA